MGFLSDHTSWYPNVRALTVYNGRLIVGGKFHEAGGLEVDCIASWDGDNWSAYASLPPFDSVCDDGARPGGCWPWVMSLGTYGDKLVAGGQYCECEIYDGRMYVAAFDGGTWVPLGIYWPSNFSTSEPVLPPYVPVPDGAFSGDPLAFISYSAGLVAARASLWNDPTSAGGILFWDGASWSGTQLVPPQGYGYWATSVCLAIYDSTLYVGGDYHVLTDSGVVDFGMAHSPEAWVYLNNPLRVTALLNYHGQLAVASQDAIFLMKDDTSLTMIGELPGAAYPSALAEYHGQLVVAGQFDSIGSVTAKNIAAWDGDWHPLGSGVDGSVAALAVYDGHLFAGGFFQHAGNKAAAYIAQWTTPAYFTIRDARRDRIPNTEFELIRMTNNRPYYAEDTLGTFITDDLGRLAKMPAGAGEFTVSLSEGDVTINTGDSIKIAKCVYSEPSVRHPGYLGTKYSIHLDNAEIGFHTTNYGLDFDTVSSEDQNIILKHTEIRYNLLVSVEWDAELEYLQGLQDEFQYMSNYLYDVTDGQVRLDTVFIEDNRNVWDQADVRIRVSNTHHPDAGVFAVHHAGAYPINMPRKWFGSEDASRNLSYINHPLAIPDSRNFRTIVHELGHYALGFFDEYRCVGFFDNSINCSQPFFGCSYGLMDYQYFRTEPSRWDSEMSDQYSYQDQLCYFTEQNMKRGMSCWDYFEYLMEGTVDNIFVPILKPDKADSTEQIIGADDFFLGPNNKQYDPDYDVGRLIHFSNIISPAPDIQSVRIKAEGVPAGGAIVWHEQAATGNVIDQGNTTDDGWIWTLGVDVTQDLVGAAGYGFAVMPKTSSGAFLNLADRVWLCGTAAASSDDTVRIELAPVQGDFPLILQGDNITETGWTFELIASSMFSTEPTVTISASDGQVITNQCAVTLEGYRADFHDAHLTDGVARIQAVDNAARDFYFIAFFEAINISSNSQLERIIGPDGTIVARLDSAASGLQEILLISTAYPVLRNGIVSDAIQVGKAHSLSITSGVGLEGINTVDLYYSESDLTPISGYRVIEEDLQVHHWDTATDQWKPLESFVDTSLDVASAPISETGVYTLFAVLHPTDIDDEESQGSLPYRFELSQNYPNPFNPVTTIEYSLPVRSQVTIEIFNVLGQKVRALVNETRAAGSYRVEWHGDDDAGRPMSTGVYLYRFQAGDHIETKKMLLLK